MLSMISSLNGSSAIAAARGRSRSACDPGFRVVSSDQILDIFSDLCLCVSLGLTGLVCKWCFFADGEKSYDLIVSPLPHKGWYLYACQNSCMWKEGP